MPLRPDQLLKLLRDDLAPFAAERKGHLSLAGDPGDILEYLTDKPLGFRLILAWAGDEDISERPELGIVDNVFEVWLIKAKGLRLHRGDFLVDGGESDTPFLRLLSDVVARVRAIEWPAEDTDEAAHYQGALPFEPELAMALPTTGYKLTFKLTATLPHVHDV